VTQLHGPSNLVYIPSLTGKLQFLSSSVVSSEDPLELLSCSATQYRRCMFCFQWVCLPAEERIVNCQTIPFLQHSLPQTQNYLWWKRKALATLIQYGAFASMYNAGPDVPWFWLTKQITFYSKSGPFQINMLDPTQPPSVLHQTFIYSDITFRSNWGTKKFAYMGKSWPNLV
jgi:hypothetical protein